MPGGDILSTHIEPKGKLAIQVTAMPADTNANGDIFGGWVISHMDMGAGIEARRRSGCRAVTVAIDSVVFLKPVNVGDTVSCYAQLLKVGRTSMQFKMEVWTLSIHEQYPKKVAEGLFTFVAINEQGQPQLVDR
ncbi:MAG: acyl-CoA thioesterase [Gammaproteobacteria bacterium RIFCSPHIGHO2_12_FULL_41_20]|nr:MAG: acyl-CoA thioesterase [Gammaproteobacteria bacterium RIFCSPHIGHO2_12_FULL_41_20]